MQKEENEHNKIFKEWMENCYPHDLVPCIYCEWYRNLDGGAKYHGTATNVAYSTPNWCCHYSLVTGDVGNPAPCFTDYKCKHFMIRKH